MRRFVIVLAVACLLPLQLIAAEPTWNPADAANEAEQDIKSGRIKFYWSGTIAAMPVGVPIDLARKYPRENAGVGCFVPDVNLRERQEKYARLYNEKIYSYITHHSS